VFFPGSREDWPFGLAQTRFDEVGKLETSGANRFPDVIEGMANGSDLR
jgi:hypothetical protein